MDGRHVGRAARAAGAGFAQFEPGCTRLVEQFRRRAEQGVGVAVIDALDFAVGRERTPTLSAPIVCTSRSVTSPSRRMRFSTGPP